MRDSTARKLDIDETQVYRYDLSRYEEAQRQRQPQPQQPNLTVRVSRPERHISGFKLFICLALTVALVSLSIYTNVMMIEMGDAIGQKAKELEQLKNETVVLQSKLESATSIKNVEEYATTSLNMGQVEKYQLTYIQLDDGDKIEKTNKAPDKTPEQRIKNAAQKMVEYLKNS